MLPVLKTDFAFTSKITFSPPATQLEVNKVSRDGSRLELIIILYEGKDISFYTLTAPQST